MLLLALTGCANNASDSGAGAPAPTASDLPSASAPALEPSTEPSGGPTAGGAETITGTVTAGVEPNCLLLVQDAKGSHLLVFDDPALKASAPVGARVTVTGRSEPGMMSTCQQGTPFIVTSVKAA
ncbi:hypothetical protein Ari01nite_76970 [Paractinoplanes rishiriensis]|uniref:Uncharacterized protein n=2 Tax=Paractinoplanes rishiriensis TaxID=1050105 RepID=A0A919K6G5_9ACTN|nr:hypothetical protein Ari01nite_76970 [Actinoplanes rishiriensis]